jgi:squalene synthase HpnC
MIIQNRNNKRKIQETYENFPLWSSFYLTNLMPDLSAIYHFCRTVDDIGDMKKNIAIKQLKDLKSDLDECFNKNCNRNDRLFPLMNTITKFNLCKKPFENLIKANDMDIKYNRYETYNDLANYCKFSANPVGEIVLQIFGHNSPKNINFSNEICTGLQIANFLQDVKRDSELGRIYIPIEDLNKFNVKESEIINQISTDNYNKLIEFESRRCWDMFNNGVQLVNHLKGYQKIPISLFISSGRKLLRKIHEINYETLQSRPVITKSEKSILTFKTITMHLFGLNLAKKKTYLE